MRHIDVLGVLYLFWGLLALVASVAVLVQAVGAVVFIAEAARTGRTIGLAAGLTAVLFLLFGAAALLWGMAHAIAGRGMRRQRPWARLLALALAVVNLFFLPFGTALAVYAFWVLLGAETRRLFDPAGPGRPSAAS
ncbi:MAG: hypothetical protein AB1806_16810 [Acidobacteriota bacterium]